MTWPTFEIGQLVDKGIADIQTGPFGTQLKASDYVEHSVPVINVRNIGYSDLRPEKIEYITDQKSDRLSVHKIKEDDIVFGRKGAVDRHLYVQAEQTGWIQGSDCIRLRFSSPEINPRFVSYSFLSSYHKQWMLNQCGNKATMASLNQDVVKRIILKLPSKTIQDIIVDTLKQYDGLIENNLRRIELLEESARHLYKEWFVRFRFPGHEHVKIIDGVPEGWKEKTFGDVFEFLGGFAFKSSTYVDDGKYSVVTIKNVHDSKFVPDCQTKVAEIPEKLKKHCRLSTGDILLSLTGNVGRTCVVYGENYFLNQRVAKIVPRNKITREFSYWSFTDRGNQKEIENLAYGVAQLNLSPVKLGEKSFTLPPVELITQFSEITSPIFDLLIKLNLSNIELSKARDLLLPKLMSGEIAV